MAASSDVSSYRIRKAVETDVPVIFKFITELSDAIKNPGSVQLDEKELLHCGFGDDKSYHCLIVEHVTSTKIDPVGHGLYYFAFSTWSGKQLFWEDVYIMPDHRNKGLGTMLMKEICKIAGAEGCRRMKWQVMKWDSDDAIRLYERWGAYRSGEHWLTYCFDQKTISKHASSTED